MSKQVLISAEEAPNFAMRCFTIQPGGSMLLHTNLVEHEQYVLSGSANVVIGEETYTVEPGNVVFIPAGAAHLREQWQRTLPLFVPRPQP